MEKSKGCSCSLLPSDCRAVHRDRWLADVLHRAKHSFVFTCEMFHSWGSETEGPVGSLLWRMNAAMMEEVEQIRKLWCLLCCRSLLIQSRDVLTHAVSEECGLFWAWHSQGAVYAVLSHPPGKWTARVPSRPTLSDDGYSALWFTPLMSNLNKMLKMDTNSNRQHQVQLNLRFIYQVCVGLFKTSLTSSSHLSVVSQEESSVVRRSAAVKLMLKEQFTEEDAFLPAYSRKWFNF